MFMIKIQNIPEMCKTRSVLQAEKKDLAARYSN